MRTGITADAGNGRKIVTTDTASLDRVRLIEHMLGRELEDATGDQAVARGPRPPMLDFSGLGRRGTIEPFDLAVGQGEVVGLAGLLGSGRTESAELLFGLRNAHSGTATDQQGPLDLRSPRSAIAAGFGFVPEERKTDGIVADLSIEQVAQIIGRSPGAVKQLQRRGLIALRRELAQRRVTR